MASKTTLNTQNLETLGAAHLARLLIEISEGNANAKRRLRLELAGSESPSKLGNEIRKRLTAIGAAFCLKAGAGLGGALPAWIMEASGYRPNVGQTAAALKGIELGIIWVPVIFFSLSVVPLLFYKKYELLEPRIHTELEARRAQQRADGQRRP